MSWRWRAWRLRRFLSCCHFDAVEVWPDEEPILPGSRGVKAHGYHSAHLTPLGVWRAVREWEAARVATTNPVECDCEECGWHICRSCICANPDCSQGRAAA